MKRSLVLAAFTLTSVVSLSAHADDDRPYPPLGGGETSLPPLPTTAPEPLPTPDEGAKPAPAPTMPPPAPKYPARFELTVGGGATYKSLFGLPMTMGNVDLAMGVHVAEMVAFNVTLDADLGQTAHGLKTRAFTIAPTIQVVADRFRIGFAPELTWLGIWRATTGEVIARGAGGARVGASFDVIKTEPVTLFIGGRGQIDWFFPSGIFSATGGAGLRF